MLSRDERDGLEGITVKVSELIDGQKDSYRTERVQLEKLEQLMKEQEIDARIHQFEPPSEPPILEAATSHANGGRDNDSNHHIRLKAVAAQYLHETGSEPLFEQSMWFGVADVGTESGERAAECGTIRIGKLLEAFGKESSIQLLGERNPAYDVLDELVYIPYTRNDDYPPVTILSLQSQ